MRGAARGAMLLVLFLSLYKNAAEDAQDAATLDTNDGEGAIIKSHVGICASWAILCTARESDLSIPL